MSHALDGCRAKLARAEESIRNFDSEIEAFLRGETPKINVVGRHSDDGLEYIFVASGNPELPFRFAVLAGEIIHHLRSSLDHVVHALILRNGHTPSRNSQFPICATLKSFEDTCSRGLIRGVTQAATKLIQGVQPYTSATPADNVLAIVNQYDIQDKHKLLVVVTTAVALGESITIGVNAEIAASPARAGKMPNIVGLGDSAPTKLSTQGTEVFRILLAEPAPELVAETTVVQQVAFEECGRVKLAPVIQTLKGLLAGTRHTVELFACEF